MSRLKQLIHEIHRRSLWQVLGIYLGGGWIALQIVDTLAGALKLPGWAAPIALVLLIIGLPIVLATAFVQEGVGRREASSEVETTAGGRLRVAIRPPALARAAPNRGLVADRNTCARSGRGRTATEPPARAPTL